VTSVETAVERMTGLDRVHFEPAEFDFNKQNLNEWTIKLNSTLKYFTFPDVDDLNICNRYKLFRGLNYHSLFYCDDRWFYTTDVWRKYTVQYYETVWRLWRLARVIKASAWRLRYKRLRELAGSIPGRDRHTCHISIIGQESRYKIFRKSLAHEFGLHLYSFCFS